MSRPDSAQNAFIKTISESELKRIEQLAAAVTCPVPPDTARRAELKQRIGELLKAQDAVLIAHYYVDDDLQSLALETGGHVADSLEMARFGHDNDASTLIVAGETCADGRG
jgi:quinolinate synthase